MNQTQLVIKTYPGSESRVSISYERQTTGDTAEQHSLESAARGLNKLSPTLKPRSERPGWGSVSPKFRPISPKSIRSLKRIVASYDERRGSSSSFYCVGTIPSSFESDNLKLAANSARVVNRVTQWLRNNGVVDYFWIWEWQLRGFLHLNLVFTSINPDLYKQWHFVWSRVISEFGIAGDWADNPDVWQTYSGLVHKSAGAYLSNYLNQSNSKKAAINKIGAALGWVSPSRWAGWSRSLSTYLRSNTSFTRVRLTTAQALELFRAIHSAAVARSVKFFEYLNLYTKLPSLILYNFPISDILDFLPTSCPLDPDRLNILCHAISLNRGLDFPDKVF